MDASPHRLRSEQAARGVRVLPALGHVRALAQCVNWNASPRLGGAVRPHGAEAGKSVGSAGTKSSRRNSAGPGQLLRQVPGLLTQLRDFLIELGRDFCFVGSEFPLQVGKQDFALDLLFFHRGLNCLVAIELKVGRFEPEYLGKLSFYLEALDRDVRKPHENPAIGVLLCASKDDEVVEYALSRSLSPALIAEYKTQLPDKKLLRAKLHELLAQEIAEDRE